MQGASKQNLRTSTYRMQASIAIISGYLLRADVRGLMLRGIALFRARVVKEGSLSSTPMPMGWTLLYRLWRPALAL